MRESLFEYPGLNTRQGLIRGLVKGFSRSEAEQDLRFLAEFDAYFSGPRLQENFVSRLPEESTTEFFRMVYSLTQLGISEGSIRNDKPPRQLARLVIYTLQSVTYRILTRGEASFDLPVKERSDFLVNLADLLDDALKPR